MILLANDVLPTAKGSSSLSASSILQGVDAVEVSGLPLIWQQIAARDVAVGHSDPDFLVAMARLFYTKATDRSAEVFQQQGFQQSSNFQSFYQISASAQPIAQLRGWCKTGEC